MWRGSEGISEQSQTRGETGRRDAALNTHRGEIVGDAVPRHAIDEVDNLSAHKTQKTPTFLAAHPTVRLHDPPTSAM
jgi:hypothetical protein